ncbi:hypothetical protein D9611_004206 [Ephemerocybe angulata]|uniref:Uncharacterized protein n=1 Tax=Ephemerocybe angulata TaxID=980116 RepID=A0A8H5BJS9_9AGAR|nr:hypothetical protein D9611_004202 [Tulosesus angulatus]KAF5324463.1 hypothetical protein D9611_004204 [Tulosesus angulatus]KAF5324557.1 hypothetical protein D9611_004206 [Tulosesus angulatus]
MSDYPMNEYPGEFPSQNGSLTAVQEPLLPPNDATRPVQYTFGPVLTADDDAFQTPPSDQQRKIGRPKSTSQTPVFIGPKRPRGRPPGKRQQPLETERVDSPPTAKRPPGRPRKNVQDVVPGTSRGQGVLSLVPTATTLQGGSSTPHSQATLGPAVPARSSNSSAGGSSSNPSPDPNAGLVSAIPLLSGEDTRRAVFEDEEEDSDDEIEGEERSLEEEASGEGIGEDGDQLGPDEVGDDLDPNEEPIDAEEKQNGASRTPKELPPWLLEYFQACKTIASDRTPQGVPRLYDELNTFWIPEKSTYLQLRHGRPSPQLLYTRRIPHPVPQMSNPAYPPWHNLATATLR